MCILCYRGEDCSYRYLVSLLDELMIEDRTEIDVDKVRLVLAGSLARTWQCRNCGDDHGAGDGCDNPDFNPLGLYTIKDE